MHTICSAFTPKGALIAGLHVCEHLSSSPTTDTCNHQEMDWKVNISSDKLIDDLGEEKVERKK